MDYWKVLSKEEIEKLNIIVGENSLKGISPYSRIQDAPANSNWPIMTIESLEFENRLVYRLRAGSLFLELLYEAGELGGMELYDGSPNLLINEDSVLGIELVKTLSIELLGKPINSTEKRFTHSRFTIITLDEASSLNINYFISPDSWYSIYLYNVDNPDGKISIVLVSGSPNYKSVAIQQYTFLQSDLENEDFVVRRDSQPFVEISSEDIDNYLQILFSEFQSHN